MSDDDFLTCDGCGDECDRLQRHADDDWLCADCHPDLSPSPEGDSRGNA